MKGNDIILWGERHERTRMVSACGNYRVEGIGTAFEEWRYVAWFDGLPHRMILGDFDSEEEAIECCRKYNLEGNKNGQ